MNIIKKATVLLLTLCAVFTLTAIPAAALDETQIDPILILSAETNLTVFVDGKISASLSGKYPYGETASISAPAVAEKTFRHWTNGNGEVISYAQSLPLTMYAPTTVNAVYGDSAETPVNLAAFTSISRYGDSIAFCGVAYAASGEVTDSGILYSTTASTLSALQALSPDEAIETSGNCWTLLVTPEDESTAYYAVAYAVAGGETCYSPVKTVKFSELESSVSLVANLGEITLQSISADEYFCNVSFDPNGGVGAMAPQGMVKDVATALNANTFTHPDKPFNCWNTKADGTGTTYADKVSVTLTGDVTLYAQWKEPATVSAAPTANTLTYDGAAHALVTAGTTAEGAIQYALGNDATTTPTGEYSATIPTGTNAGTYYVWYKVVGDDSHTDSDPACVTVTINKAAITPTLTMSGWTYGGTASSPGVTSGNSGNGTVTYSYKLATAEDEAYDSAAPTAAGTYKVRAEIAETSNYLGKTVEAEFTVSKAALTVTASSGSVTYGDAPKGFGVTYSGFVNSDTESVLSGAVSYSFDYTQYGNAGTYKITPSGLSAANYEIAYADGALTVNPKTVGLTWGETSFVYNGTSKLPTATATGLVNNDSCNVTVTGAQTDVGENYTATASALSNSNYALPTENTASFKITPGTQDGVSATDFTGTYDGAAHSIAVTASNGGTVTYSETDAGTYSATNPAYTNAGTYTVYYKVARTGYNDAAGSAKVTITQKAVGLLWGDTAFSYDGTEKLPTATATGLIDGDACAVTVAGAQTNIGENYTATASALSNSNYALPAENTTSFKITPGTQDGIAAADYAGTYDGAAHGITVTASNGGTVTFSETQSGAYSATNPTYTDAGTYAVYYKVEKAGYHDATGSANVKINKKSVTVSGLTAATKTYDGTVTAELVASGAAYDGLLSGDSLSVAGTAAFADADAGDGKTVNITGLSLSGTAAGNYALSADAATGTGKIAKRPITITAANQTVGLAGSISEGADKAAVSSGSLVDGHSISAITLTSSDTANVTTSGTITPSAATIKSGAADVTANYEIAYANGVLTVQEGAPAVTAPTANALAYNGEAQALTTTGSVTGGTMEYALSSDASAAPVSGYAATIPTGTNAGTYYVWYRVTGDSNHSDVAAACVAVTIGKGTPTVVALTANALTYDGTAKSLVAAGSATGGALEYAPGADGTAAPASGWGTAIPTGTDAGTYYVWYRVTGNDNYNGVAASSVAATIGKKAATVTANPQTVALNGAIDTAVSNAVLSGAADGHTLSAVTLTGSDTANATASGTITPSAAKIFSGETDVTENYEITYVNGVLTVSQGESGVIAPTAKELTYSGAAQELVTAGTATGGAMRYALGTDGSAAPANGYDTAIPTGSDAGTYYVWYKVVGDADHTDTAPACVTVTIGKAAITPTVTITGWSCGETANAPSVTGNTGNGTVTYAYKLKTAEDEAYDSNVPVDAGTYKVRAVISETSNYLGKTVEAEFTITESDSSALTAPTAKELTYSGAAQELVTPGTATDGAMQYALGNDATTAPTGEYSTTIPTGTNAGTYYVWYKVTGDSNHSDIDAACVTVTIRKAAIAPSVSMNGWTYGESANAPVVTGNSGSGSVVYGYKLRTAEDEAYDSAVPANAGEYAVRAVISETGNYNGGEASANFTISKRDVTVSGITAADKQYNGNTDATLIYTDVAFDGLMDGDALSVTATGAFEDAEVGEDKTVNITDLTLEDDSKDNYQLAETGQQSATTASITATPTYTVIWLNGDGTQLDRKTYTEGQQEPTTDKVPVKESDAVNVYTFSKWDNGVTEGNVKTYTPEFTATAKTVYTVIWLNGDGTQLDRKTYTEGQQEPTTDKVPVKESDAENVYTFSKWDNGVTDGNVKTYAPEFTATAKASYTVIWLNGDGTELDRKTYTEGQQEPTTDKTPTKAADAENTYAFSGWDSGAVEGNVKTYRPEFAATPIGKEPEKTLTVTAEGWTGAYDGETHSITVTAPADATVTYSGSANGTYGAENPAYKDAGNYTVYYRVEKSGYDTVSGSATIAISKTTLIPTLTFADRSNPDATRNSWPYQGKTGVPKLTMEREKRNASLLSRLVSLFAPESLTVTDYGMTAYSYKERTATEYLPYTAEELENLPVGQYVLRVEVAESKNYNAVSAEANFSVVKAAHDNMETEPVKVLSGSAGLSADLSAYLEEGAVCSVSGVSGMVGGSPAMDGNALLFDTGAGSSGTVRVTVSSRNYEDYAITIQLTAATSFMLRFDSNGGNEVTETRTLRAGEAYGTLPVPTRAGYTFDGWHTAPENGTQVGAATVMGGADATLYAHWTAVGYAVTLRLNGGTLAGDTAGWTVSGDTATKQFQIDTPDFTLPESERADSHSFIGWREADESARLEVTVYQGTARNLTYEAQWMEGTANGEVEFVRTDDSSNVMGIQDLEQDRDDMDAQRSSTEADGYRPSSLAQAMKEIAADIAAEDAAPDKAEDVTVTLKTRTVPDLSETPDGNLSEQERTAKREQTQIKAEMETLGVYNAAEQAEPDFLEINMEKTVSGGADAERISEASRVVEIPVRYNLTGRYNPVVFRFHNAASVLRRLASRPRDYRNLDGCFYVSGMGDDAVIYIYSNRFSTYSIATSEAETYTVFFDADGGSQVDSQTVRANGTATKPANPAKDGYDFAGWRLQNSDTEFDFSTPITEDVRLYANWTAKTPVAPSPSGGGSGGSSGSAKSYSVTVADAEHGSVKVSAKTATNGTRITVTATPESGYLTDSVTVKTAADKNVSVTKSGTNAFRFTMPANDVTVSAAFVKQTSDSGDAGTKAASGNGDSADAAPDNGNATLAAPDGGDSATDAKETPKPLSPEETGVADWLITDTHPAYISGFSDGTFRPNANITRAQAAMMFYRLLKNPNVATTVSFTDMNGGEWYAEAVYALASMGVIQGYSDGAFHGNDAISRAAFTAIAIRLAKKTVPDNAERFSDVPGGHWACETIARASDYGWIGGYSDGTFHPAAPITRAAVAAIINRMLNRNADEEYVAEHYAELNRFSDVTDSNAWYFHNVMEASNAHGFAVSDGKERWSA